LRESVKKTLTVQSRRATASSLLFLLKHTDSTSSVICSVLTCFTPSLGRGVANHKALVLKTFNNSLPIDVFTFMKCIIDFI